MRNQVGPYFSRPAACRDYDPRAVDVARLVAALTCEHLPQVRVEYVGSTSVPECAGKGYVDLMIALGDYAARRKRAGASCRFCSARSVFTRNFTHDSQIGNALSAVAQSMSSTCQY